MIDYLGIRPQGFPGTAQPMTAFHSHPGHFHPQPWGHDGYSGGVFPGLGMGGPQAFGSQDLTMMLALLMLFQGIMGSQGMGGGMPGQGLGGMNPGLGGGGFPGVGGGGFPGVGGFPGANPGLGGNGLMGGQALQTLAKNPKALGPGAGMPMLPPNAGQEQFKAALEQRFGMPFEQIREQYAQAHGDKGKLKRKGATSKIQPGDLYKQIMLESEFGTLTQKGKDPKLLGGFRPEATKHANKAYEHLYQAKGGANANAGAAGGSSMAVSIAISMCQCGCPPSIAIAIATSQCGGSSGQVDSAAYAKAQSAFEEAVKAGTPILLDLEGEGVPPVEEGEWKPHPHKFTAKNKRLFDLDADGIKELVEWVNPGGALLCLPDARGDVPNGRHLFGDAGGFKDGYQKLALHDLEGKGYVDSRDMERAGIAVWVDANGDALVDEGEIKSCAELRITRIYTAHQDYQSTFVHEGREKKTWDWWPTYRKVTVGVR